MNHVQIEAAVESSAAARAAAEGGAHRIELCADLAHGGTTPDAQLIRECVAQLAIPVFVLVRPRAGDFVYTGAEHRVMLEQIRHAKAGGARGIVTGALDRFGAIDASMGVLIRAARPLPVTCHRAFDECRDLPLMLDLLIDLGVERVLTSGGARTAPEGAARIAQLVARAQGRITVLAGGGINPDNVAALVQRTGVREVHFSVKEAEKARAVIRALK